MSEHDPINHPSHYTSSPAKCRNCATPIECIDVTRHLGFNVGNAIKYLWRFEGKNGVEDLKKAAWYIADEIAKREAAAPHQPTGVVSLFNCRCGLKSEYVTFPFTCACGRKHG